MASTKCSVQRLDDDRPGAERLGRGDRLGAHDRARHPDPSRAGGRRVAASRPAPDDAIVSAQIAPSWSPSACQESVEKARWAAPRLAGMARGAKCLIQVTVGQIQRPPILTARWSRSTVMPSTAAVSASSRATGMPMLSKSLPDQAELPVGDAAGEQDRCLRLGRARPSLTWLAGGAADDPGTRVAGRPRAGRGDDPRNPAAQVEHVAATSQLPAERAGRFGQRSTPAVPAASAASRSSAVASSRLTVDATGSLAVGSRSATRRRTVRSSSSTPGALALRSASAAGPAGPGQARPRWPASRSGRHRTGHPVGLVPRSSTERTPMHSPLLISGAAMMEVGT